LVAWLIAIMLIITEIINMVTGVSTAFSGVVFYDHYAAVHRLADAPTFSALDDQALAGAVLWVGGSFIYISSIILVLNRLFEKHGSSTPEAFPDWDADERMIMPGLEHRVRR
jgi:cytochrome c oxidase assembly factor CtaG